MAQRIKEVSSKSQEIIERSIQKQKDQEKKRSSKRPVKGEGKGSFTVPAKEGSFLPPIEEVEKMVRSLVPPYMANRMKR